MIEESKASQRDEGQPLVQAQRLSKVFKDFWMRDQVRAVDALDMTIYRGQIFGLIGPNGSGKSTTIKMILGLLHKTSGRLAVFGKPPTDVAVKRRIGYLPEESYLYPFLNSRETLDFYGRLFGLPGRVRERRVDELLKMVGLEAVQYRPIGQFSKGMQRRVGIAQALINDPDFLILDEPTSGLDPIGIRQIKDLILDLGRRGKTILLSSHLLSEVEDVCDHMVILYGGKKRAEGTRDELLTADERTVIETDALDPEQADRVRRMIEMEAGRHVYRLEPARQRLETLFLNIVDRAEAEKLKTHGAGRGGPTADFLRLGDNAGEPVDAQAGGDALIRELMAEDRPPAPATPSGGAPHAAPGQAATRTHAESVRDLSQPDENVLGSLLRDDRKPTGAAPAAGRHEPTGGSTPAARPGEFDQPAPPSAPAHDDSVISALLGGGHGNDRDKDADSDRRPGNRRS